ncbi:MAG: hypothetical protein J0H12_03965 [Candidatus Paracaedimonas acanthamoebae]|uniref:Uncharacterized protein n=1 Tax=Candidatus Paracaedimonas acanthamoebae TaxID=244581 RepID=A0A8J7PW33_9PROT|nr:hypothetical protein [Candidatus Paracaedimonas acanthamoebae]
MKILSLFMVVMIGIVSTIPAEATRRHRVAAFRKKQAEEAKKLDEKQKQEEQSQIEKKAKQQEETSILTPKKQERLKIIAS